MPATPRLSPTQQEPQQRLGLGNRRRAVGCGLWGRGRAAPGKCGQRQFERRCAVLPTELSGRIDWSSLELQPTSFVDERLSGLQADVLFTLQCQGRKTYLYVLLEHQSAPDALMAIRLLRYLVRIWEAFLIEHPESERLPAILG